MQHRGLAGRALAGLLFLCCYGSAVDASTLDESLVAGVRHLPVDSLDTSFLMVIDDSATSAGQIEEPAHSHGPIAGDSMSDAGTYTTTRPVEWLAQRFNRHYEILGHVAVLAPRTMTVLSPPASDSTSASMPLDDALRIFLDSLTADQWRQAVSGAALTDFTGLQQKLFNELVARPLDIAPGSFAAPGGEGEERVQWGEVYNSAVLHITTEQVMAATKLKISLTTPDARADDDSKFDFAIVPDSVGSGRVYGDAPTITQCVPNVLKDSQLPDIDMSVTVHVEQTQTVDDLVNAIATASSLELYCDPRFASRTVTIVGRLDHLAEASEIATALRYCLCGAWRKVGSAYVLTDDLAGLGSRRHAVRADVNADTERMSNRVSRANADLITRCAALPGSPTLLRISCEVPGVPGFGRVVLGEIPCSQSASKADVGLTSVVTDRPVRRLDVIEPATADEARELVDGQADVGEKSVYCLAFRGGCSLFPSKSQPPANPVDANILPAAIEEGKAKGLKVYAVVDALRWDRRRGYLEDLTVDGQSAQQDTVDMGIADLALGGHWASPMAPSTREILGGIVRELAATDDLAGIVLRNAAPPGYSANAASPVDLGYTEAMRLGYLRLFHVDPIDIDNPYETNVSIGSRNIPMVVSSFNLEDAGPVLPRQWREFRHMLQMSLVTELVTETGKIKRGLPVLVEED